MSTKVKEVSRKAASKKTEKAEKNDSDNEKVEEPQVEKSEKKSKGKGDSKKSDKKPEKKSESKPTKEVVKSDETTEKSEKSDKAGDNTLKFESQLAAIQEAFKAVSEQLRSLGTQVKKLESAHKHDVKHVSRHKQKRSGDYKPTGFAKKTPVPKVLASFIGVEADTMMSGPEITSKVWAQLKAKNLTYEKDKRVFRTNEEISKIFGVPKSVNKSTTHNDKDGFNFCNLQRFIAHALGRDKTPEKEAEKAEKDEVKDDEKPKKVVKPKKTDK